MSLLTQLSLMLLAALPSAYSKESGRAILERSQKEFQESQKQLETTHNEYIEKLSNLYEAETKQGSDRAAAIEKAKEGLVENEKRANQIIQGTYLRLNKVFEAIEFNENGVLLDEKSAPTSEKKPDEKKAADKKEAEIPSPFPTTEKSPGKKKASLKEPEAQPTPVAVEEKKEVENAEGSQYLIFKKKKKQTEEQPASKN